MAPTSGQPVNVALITDGQTNVTPGGSITMAAIGAPAGVPLFNGNVTISGNTITVATGQLSSFLTEGFQVGQRLQIQGTGTADDNAATAAYTIIGVTDSSITLASGSLTAAFSGCTGGASCVTLSRVVNQGLYSGSVIYNSCASMVNNACVGTLTRSDGSSWLDDGFLEGQLFQINGAGPLFKIQALTGTTASKVDVLQVTTADFTLGPNNQSFTEQVGGFGAAGLLSRHRHRDRLAARVGGAGHVHVVQLVRADRDSGRRRPVLQRLVGQREAARVPEGPAPAVGDQGPAVGRGWPDRQRARRPRTRRDAAG